MAAVLAFAVTLLVAVLLSGLARRSVLSTALLFLVAGFVAGKDVTGIVDVAPGQPSLELFIELALFSVLFTDGMRVGVRQLTGAWRLPGRALLLGMPITLGVIALLAHLLFDLPWIEAFLLGAALSPTDPVLAAAIVGREEVPARLRHLLNVESGLNDGLALPIVIATLALAGEHGVPAGELALEIAGGIAIGVAVPWAAIRLQRVSLFAAASLYEPLGAFAIGAIVFALTSLVHYNLFLAAFSAGVTVATLSGAVRDAFQRFGELVTELLKLGALFLFGALIPIGALGAVGWLVGVGFALLVLFVARPVGVGIAFLGSHLDLGERVTAAWFGPKGFASVAYGLIILHGNIPQGSRLFAIVALVTAISIVAHSSSDVIVARWFRRRHEEEEARQAEEEAEAPRSAEEEHEEAEAEMQAEAEAGVEPETEPPPERGERPDRATAGGER